MQDLGKLSAVEFREDGADIQQAVAMLSTGEATMPQFVAWQRLRDDYVAGKARASASTRAIGVKHSEKGFVMLTGVRGGKYAIGAYPREWMGIAENLSQVLEYLRSNRSVLEKLTADKTTGRTFPLDVTRLGALADKYAAK